jgi:hypothetical protein
MGQRDGVALKSRSFLALAWRDDDTFREAVRNEQQKIAVTYNRMLAQLITDGRLTAEEAAMLPLLLTTTVYDGRTDRTPPLPDVSISPAK